MYHGNPSFIIVNFSLQFMANVSNLRDATDREKRMLEILMTGVRSD